MSKVEHRPDNRECKLTRALGPVGIECDHGRDVCPICDPCTCAPLPTTLEQTTRRPVINLGEPT